MATTSLTSSLLGSSTSSSTSYYFNGTSSYSSDLQSVIARELQIASLPVTHLQDQVSTLKGQSSEVSSLQSAFSTLRSTIQEIDTAVSGTSYQTSVSSPSVLSANVGDGAVEGNYSVLVQDVGAYSTSLTTASWQDTAGAAKTYQLLVGGKSYNITPTNNSAASVAAAINAQQGGRVQATVVNVGGQSSPDYRISLQSATLDGNPVDLQLNGSSLQKQQVTGRPAQYQVNNSGVTVTSNIDSVTIAQGLTVQMLASSNTAVNITLTRSSAALSSALSDFANAYNAAATAVAGQRGQSGGAMQGQSVVLDLANTLSQIATYTGTGNSVNTLAGLGLTLGSDGQMTYDPTTLLGADLTSSGSVNAFLGSAATGGFLQIAANRMSNLLDPTSGELPTTATNIQKQITNLNTNISTKQDQVNQLQTQLTNEMASADALISSMQQQYNYLSGMFQAMQVAALQNARG